MEPLGFGKRLIERVIGDPEVSGTHEAAPDGFLLAYGAVGRARPAAGARVGRRRRADDSLFSRPAARPRHGRLRADRSVPACFHRRAPDRLHPDIRSLGDDEGHTRPRAMVVTADRDRADRRPAPSVRSRSGAWPPPAASADVRRSRSPVLTAGRGMTPPLPPRNRPTTARGRPDHVVQIVNSQLAVFTKQWHGRSTAGEHAARSSQASAACARAAEQRRGRPMTSWRTLAGRDADLPAHGVRSPIARDRASPRGRVRLRARAPARPARRRRLPPAPQRPTPAPQPAAGTYAICYADERRAPIRSAPCYRYALQSGRCSRLSASGDLAGRLLRADQHRRRRDPEARLRRRAREDAEGRSRRASSASIIDGVNFLNNADLDGRRCRRQARRT